MQNIKDIYDLEINYLIEAVKHASNPYHTFVLSTINENFPETRTVVLRDVSISPFKIYFNADYRSNKVKELIENKNSSALFYDKDRKVQVRMKCAAIINFQNDISLKKWNGTALQSRKCYMGPYAPSTKLKDWHPNVPEEFIDSNPTLEKSQKGYDNFAHIELTVLELDILKLRYNGHIRFKVENEKIYHISP